MARKFHGMNKDDGGHTLITDKLIEDICKDLRKGNYIETACAKQGISKTIFYEWLRKARRHPSDYPLCVKFMNAVLQAEAEFEATGVDGIDKAAKSDWRAEAWRLERRFPKRWGRLDRIEMNDPDSGPIDFGDLTDEDLEKRAEALVSERSRIKAKQKK